MNLSIPFDFTPPPKRTDLRPLIVDSFAETLVAASSAQLIERSLTDES